MFPFGQFGLNNFLPGQGFGCGLPGQFGGLGGFGFPGQFGLGGLGGFGGWGNFLNIGVGAMFNFFGNRHAQRQQDQNLVVIQNGTRVGAQNQSVFLNRLSQDPIYRALMQSNQQQAAQMRQQELLNQYQQMSQRQQPGNASNKMTTQKSVATIDGNGSFEQAGQDGLRSEATIKETAEDVTLKQKAKDNIVTNQGKENVIDVTQFSQSSRGSNTVDTGEALIATIKQGQGKSQNGRAIQGGKDRVLGSKNQSATINHVANVGIAGIVEHENRGAAKTDLIAEGKGRNQFIYNSTSTNRKAVTNIEWKSEVGSTFSIKSGTEKITAKLGQNSGTLDLDLSQSLKGANIIFAGEDNEVKQATFTQQNDTVTIRETNTNLGNFNLGAGNDTVIIDESSQGLSGTITGAENITLQHLQHNGLVIDLTGLSVFSLKLPFNGTPDEKVKLIKTIQNSKYTNTNTLTIPDPNGKGSVLLKGLSEKQFTQLKQDLIAQLNKK